MAVVVMGLSGLIAQILLLRELLIVCSGNELSIGIVLANWLMLEALGSFLLSRRAENFRKPLEAFSVLTVLFSSSLFLSVFLTRILKQAIGVSLGESIGIGTVLYASFLILMPVSVLHGALFAHGCRIYSLFSREDTTSTGRVYVYETAGAIIGGIACTYLVISAIHTFLAAAWIALVNVLACLVLLAPAGKEDRPRRAALVLLSVLALASAYLVFGGWADRLHQYSVRAQWKGQQVVHYQNSPYGNICILENEGQYLFFLDGVPDIITPVPDIPAVEEFVHLPLLAHPAPSSILLLGGGAGGIIHEALQHPSIETIEYAELDPLLIDLLRAFPTALTEAELNDPRVKLQRIDGHLFLKTAGSAYDLIFLGITEPSSLQANRFFTREFFSLAKTRLKAGGALVLGLPGSLTYVQEELKNLNSCVYHTLAGVFSAVRVIPGAGRNLFLASDSPEVAAIDLERFRERVSERKIGAGGTIPWHLESRLHRGWQDWFSRFLEGGSRKINKDLRPIGLFYSISHWNALHAPSLRGLFRRIERIETGTVLLVFAAVLVPYALVRSRLTRIRKAGIPLAVFTTGVAGMLFDLLLICTFQSLYGYVFSWMGLLVAAFMAGTACGAVLVTRLLERMRSVRQWFLRIDLAVLVLALAFPALFHAVHAAPAGPADFAAVKALFLAVSFVCGLPIGAQFPLANALYLKEGGGVTRTAGLLYASDLLGGWLGGIAGAVVLLPVLGIAGACITGALLKAAGLLVVTSRPAGGEGV